MTTKDDSTRSAAGDGHAANGHGPGDEEIPPGALEPGTEAYINDPGHFGIEHGAAWPEDVPRGQNDMHWRFEDDPKGARRAEIRIAACWSLMVFAGLGLAVTYVTGGQSQIEGALLCIGFAGLGAGLVLWARDLLPGHEVTATRGGLLHPSTEEERRRLVQSLGRGLEPIARRPFLGKMLGGVLGIFGVGILFPLASLGPRSNGQLKHTSWRSGIRAVTEDGVAIKPSDILAGGVLTVFPNTGEDLTSPNMAQSGTILINLGYAAFEVRAGRETWHLGAVGSGNCIVAFSKICTHAGCPVSLYDVQSHELVCPCHQSTFSVLQDCKPIFGPAPRNLAQLPLAIDTDGYIIAQHDYYEPVGPGFWNRPEHVS